MPPPIPPRNQPNIVTVPGAAVACDAIPASRVPGAASVGGGGASVPGGSGGFDPAGLSLSGWFRIAFPGVPWPGTASMGSSGDGVHDLNTAGADPTASTALNGFASALFNGTTQYLVGEQNWDQFFGATSGSIVWLANQLSASADAGAGLRINNAGFVAQEGGTTTFNLGYSTSGYTLAVFNSGASYDEIVLACATGAYNSGMVTWDGVNVTMRLNSAGITTLACDGPTTTAIAWNVGKNFLSSFTNMRLAELMTASTALTTPNYTNVKSYFNTRYGLAL